MSGFSVLPLSDDSSSRFLPWLIAFLVWLATIALAAVMILSSYSNQWRNDLTGTLTVQITAASNGEIARTEQRLNLALDILRNTPGIIAAEPVPLKHVFDLLSPWLDRDLITETLNLPIPRLIAVKLHSKENVDIDLLSAKLNKEIDNTQIDNHSVWLDKIITITKAIEIIALAVLVLIGLAVTSTIVFATQTSLAIHRNTIDLLHVIGAEDAYVANQFQRHAFTLGLKGGIAGVLIATVNVLGLGILWSDVASTMLPTTTLTIGEWCYILSVSLVAAMITTFTARITVLRALGHLP